MGCVPSKLTGKHLKKQFSLSNGNNDVRTHVVSLTSSTYGALDLGLESPPLPQPPQFIKKCVTNEITKPEVINAWELMEDLDEETEKTELPCFFESNKSPKLVVLDSRRSPLRFSNQKESPKKQKRFRGKENNNVARRAISKTELSQKTESSPKTESSQKTEFSGPKTESSKKTELSGLKTELKTESCQKTESKTELSGPKTESSQKTELSGPKTESRQKTESSQKTELSGLKTESSQKAELFSKTELSGPLFDPELIAFFEKELSEEAEQSISTKQSNHSSHSTDSNKILEQFDKLCPPGGENAVVIYTTTLRGIRKTFEDCNRARAILELHQIRILERDISMDSGLKNELRGLMGKNEARVPIIFVKGRLIGGAEEIVRLEEEGKLGILLQGIPNATVSSCDGCGGFRFVLCLACDGSCKTVSGDGKFSVKCGECNENGLVKCPICC